MEDSSKSKESAPSPADTGSNNNQPLFNIRIKQEPGTEAYDVSPVPVTAQATSFLGHFRSRSYSRMSHASSPDTAVCEVCQSEFPNYESLQLHKMAHFNTSHVCYVCDCYFWNSDTLNLHMATIHRELNIANHNHKGELFVCSICIQRFSSSKTLVKHQSQHAKNDENFFGCRVCGLDFIGYRALLAHLNSPRHKEMKVKIQSIFVCVDCRSIFASRDSYAMHMMVRAQNESCDSINTSSLQMSMEAAAKREMQNDTGEPHSNGISNHTSDGCDPVTPLNLSTRLDREKVASSFIMRHPETIPGGYKCTMCNSYYPTQDALAMHAMSHARSDAQKEKDILTSLLPRQQCTKCLAHFPNADSLAMHAMMHAKDEAERDVIRPIGFLPGLVGTSMEVRPSSAPLPAQQLGMKKPDTRCSRCDVSFDSRDEYAMHFIDKHVQGDKGSSTTSINGKVNGITEDKELGMKRCHSVDDSSEQGLQKMRKLTTKDNDEGKINCTVCSKKIDKSDMIEHKLKCKLSYKCHTCDMAFVDDFTLRCHLKSQHHLSKAGKESGGRGEKIRCHICGFMAEYEEQYMNHMYMHNPGMTGQVARSTSRPSSVVNTAVSDSTANTGLERPHSAGVLETPSDSMVGSSIQGRRSRRKPKASARVLPNNLSPEPSDSSWMDDSGQIDTIGSTVRHYMSTSPCLMRTMHAPCSPRALPQRESPMVPSSTHQSVPGDSPGQSSPSQTSPRPSTTAPPQAQDEMKDADIVDYVLSNVEALSMCKFCKIVYTDQTMYYLHMGLHNLNNPWQCNLCGKACRNVHEFSSHVIHY